MSSLSIPVPALRAAYSHAADGDVRYYLNGVYVDTQAGRLVATDGHRMMIVKIDRAPELEPFILPAVAVESILKQVKGKKFDKHLIMVEVEPRASGPHSLVLTANGMKVGTSAIDGKFPDYTRVVPKEISGATAQFNWQYVADAQSALREYFIGTPKMTSKGGAPFLAHNGNGPAVVFMPGYKDEAFVIIMPARNDGSVDEAKSITAEIAVPQSNE